MMLPMRDSKEPVCRASGAAAIHMQRFDFVFFLELHHIVLAGQIIFLPLPRDIINYVGPIC